MCEKNGVWNKRDYCADNEWCIGSTDSTSSTYQVDSLCLKGNAREICLRDVFNNYYP